ncbi:hypothetical protein EH165_14440 [Nakamurella antarctica]|uniref:Lycopene cyclase domain-containing protein n=1 Tax=Nakamurella antarctica TaxID=1902245 RepID=A0A3G8ZPI2_9ACTN|nr:lycopene cyclase domain-containing protein [Nakamurella antarctica]AZI59160.1 hypothetical protein EH165_14440 [Nakamurella antarctica]
MGKARWWWFDKDDVPGIFIGSLPLEEWLFFVVIAMCAIISLEAVANLKPQWAQPRAAKL